MKWFFLSLCHIGARVFGFLVMPFINFKGNIMYQGHLSDGSSVQKHSAGGLYPCVLFAQETEKGLQYGIITPKDQTGTIHGSHDDAVNAALKYLNKA